MFRRYSLNNKIVLVTGASSGIGREISREMAERGADCILSSLPSEKVYLEEWAEHLHRKHGVLTWSVAVNLAREDGPHTLYGAVKKIHPYIDVLVNNAGVMVYGNFHEISLERQDILLKVNARAYMILMHLFLRDMIDRGEGRILNVSSASAFAPTPHHAVYGATKAFVQNLTEAAREEIRGTGVLLCTLNPGYVDTPLLHGEDFPRKVPWFSLGGLDDPIVIARQGVDAMVRGKAVYSPGGRNWLSQRLMPRLLPRAWRNRMLYYVLKGRNGGGPERDGS